MEKYRHTAEEYFIERAVYSGTYSLKDLESETPKRREKEIREFQERLEDLDKLPAFPEAILVAVVNHVVNFRSNTNKLLDVIDYYMNRGVSINTPDENGNTPLHYAAWQGMFSLIEGLLDRGAKTLVYNVENATPLDLFTYVRVFPSDPFIVDKFLVAEAREREELEELERLKKQQERRLLAEIAVGPRNVEGPQLKPLPRDVVKQIRSMIGGKARNKKKRSKTSKKY